MNSVSNNSIDFNGKGKEKQAAGKRTSSIIRIQRAQYYISPATQNGQGTSPGTATNAPVGIQGLAVSELSETYK
jgi:hypothetical protein